MQNISAKSVREQKVSRIQKNYSKKRHSILIIIYFGKKKLGQPGIRSRFATLTVLVPPELPRITQGDFLLIAENKEIELECISYGGKPIATVSVL